MRHRFLAPIAGLLLLILATVVQIPLIQDMALHLLKQSMQLTRGALPRYKNLLLPTISTSSSSLNRFLYSPKPPPSAPFSTSMKMAANSKAFLTVTEERRSLYELTNESPIPDDRIKDLVHHAIKHVPSAFNSRTTRIVVVVKEKHQQLWDSILDVYKTVLPDDKFQHAKGRMVGFRAAYGTILFYEDTTTIREYQEKFKTYEDKFPEWSDQTNGMHQYLLWSALNAEGLGVNLQHYNPLIDKRIEGEFDVPGTWSLKAQMVFGKNKGKPKEKDFGDVEGRIKFIG